MWVSSRALGCLFVTLGVPLSSAWTPSSTLSRANIPIAKNRLKVSTPFSRHSPKTHLRLSSFSGDEKVSLMGDGDMSSNLNVPLITLVTVSTMVASFPAEAEAATGGVSRVLSAFAAYGHFLSLLIIVGALVTERFTVKPNMSDEEEDRLALADIVLGISGALLAYTGYLRVTEYGKGWEFYAHEPIFWLKTTLVAIFGAVSFFPTTKIIQRSIDKRNGKLVPMSEKLSSRLVSLINAELLMVASIPLTASLMARGVAYTDAFPWQLGVATSSISLVGLGYKYVNEALTWSEDEKVTDVVD